MQLRKCMKCEQQHNASLCNTTKFGSVCKFCFNDSFFVDGISKCSDRLEVEAELNSRTEKAHIKAVEKYKADAAKRINNKKLVTRKTKLQKAYEIVDNKEIYSEYFTVADKLGRSKNWEMGKSVPNGTRCIMLNKISDPLWLDDNLILVYTTGNRSDADGIELVIRDKGIHKILKEK